MGNIKEMKGLIANIFSNLNMCYGSDMSLGMGLETGFNSLKKEEGKEKILNALNGIISSKGKILSEVLNEYNQKLAKVEELENNVKNVLELVNNHN
jgi:hypothetical protein